MKMLQYESEDNLPGEGFKGIFSPSDVIVTDAMIQEIALPELKNFLKAVSLLPYDLVAHVHIKMLAGSDKHAAEVALTITKPSCDQVIWGEKPAESFANEGFGEVSLVRFYVDPVSKEGRQGNIELFKKIKDLKGWQNYFEKEFQGLLKQAQRWVVRAHEEGREASAHLSNMNACFKKVP